MDLPDVVSQEEWQAAREQLLAKEKAATRVSDALAAERRRQPIYRTYFTNRRGVDGLGSVWSFLDLTPLGRQEDWEDSPEGRPQTAPYRWWRRHDEYEETNR
jgi:predicted dithiol-disulfide oxidoreductase (DUF899 family)